MVLKRDLRLTVYVCAYCARMHNTHDEAHFHESTCRPKSSAVDQIADDHHDHVHDGGEPLDIKPFIEPSALMIAHSSGTAPTTVFSPTTDDHNGFLSDFVKHSIENTGEDTVPDTVGIPPICRGIRPPVRDGSQARHWRQQFYAIVARRSDALAVASTKMQLQSRIYEDNYTHASRMGLKDVVERMVTADDPALQYGVYSPHKDSVHSGFVRVLHQRILTPFSACINCGRLFNILLSRTTSMRQHMRGTSCSFLMTSVTTKTPSTSTVKTGAISKNARPLVKMRNPVGIRYPYRPTPGARRPPANRAAPNAVVDADGLIVRRGGVNMKDGSMQRNWSVHFTHVLERYDAPIDESTARPTTIDDNYTNRSDMSAIRHVAALVGDRDPRLLYGVYTQDPQLASSHFVRVICASVMTPFAACRRCGKCVGVKHTSSLSMRSHMSACTGEHFVPKN